LTPFSKEDILVGELAESLSLACGIAPEMAKMIGKAGTLHDAGKIAIPEYIINKPGRLSPKEFEIIKTHTLWGAVILSKLQGRLRTIAMNVAAFHHEKWDGSGYWGYRGDDVPYYCQIVSLCDIIVALSVRRNYKEPWPPIEVVNYIKNESGKTFCPKLVKTFLGCKWLYPLTSSDIFFKNLEHNSTLW